MSSPTSARSRSFTRVHRSWSMLVIVVAFSRSEEMGQVERGQDAILPEVDAADAKRSQGRGGWVCGSRYSGGQRPSAPERYTPPAPALNGSGGPCCKPP